MRILHTKLNEKVVIKLFFIQNNSHLKAQQQLLLPLPQKLLDC